MPDNTGELITTFESCIAAPRVVLDVLDSDTPFLRHVVALNENGLEVETLDEADHQVIPRRPVGTRTVTEVDSFLAELTRRPLPPDTGTLWGAVDHGVITAIYNDHGDANTPATAGWRDDRLELRLKTDPDWAAWHGLSGKYLRQNDIGDKLEELLHTVTAPDQAELLAELLEVVDSIRASSKGEFESSIERARGSQGLVYKQDVTAKPGRTRQLEVPETISLELRPWEGHPNLHQVDAWFRLRVTDGELCLAVKLKPTRQILRTAWADLTDQIVGQVGRPVYAQP